MVRIPVYEQQRLASSVAGVPPIDQSGATVARSIQRGAGQVADAAFSAAVERREIIDNAEALRISSDLELQAFQAYDEHTRAYSNQPTDKTAILQERLNEKYTAAVESASSDRVRAKVSSMGQRIMNNTTMQEAQWARQQEGVVAFNNITATINTRANEAYVAGRTNDFNRFLDVMSATPIILSTAKGVLSAEQQAHLEELAPESQVVGYINGGLDSNPAIIAEQLKDGKLDFYKLPDGTLKQLLKPEDRNKYLAIAHSRMAKMTETYELNRLSNVLSQQDELVDKFIGGDVRESLTLADVEAIEDPETRKVFQKLYEDINPTSNEEDAQVADQLNLEYYEMTGRFANKKNSAKRANLEELINFRNKVYQNMDKISESQRNQFLKELLPAMAKKAKAGDRRRGHYAEGYGEILAWTERRKDLSADGRKQVRNAAFNQYVAALKTSVNRKNSQGLPITAAEVLSEVKRSFYDPKYLSFKLGDTVTNREGRLFKVTGFNQDTGEPELVETK